MGRLNRHRSSATEGHARIHLGLLIINNNSLSNFCPILNLQGFKSLADFKTKICIKQFTNDQMFLDKINTEISKIKKLFNISQMSLAKNNYIIKTPLQAFQLLKHCLQQLNIGFQKIKVKNTNYLRLIEPNFLYFNHIKMLKESNLSELVPNIQSDSNKSIENEFEYFDDLYNKLEIIDVKGSNKETLMLLYNKENVKKYYCAVRRKVVQGKVPISKEFIIYDKEIHVLYEIIREGDIFDSSDYEIVNDNKECISDGKYEVVVGNSYFDDHLPLIACQYHKVYALIKLPKDVDINAKISSSISYINVHNTRHMMAQSPWKFRTNQAKLSSGMAKGGIEYLKEDKGTQKIGIKFNGLKGSYKFDHGYGQISNIKFRTTHKSRWIMVCLYIGTVKVKYYNDHYNDVPIPLYLLKYHDVKFEIELSASIPHDTQDYLEISFDYNKSKDLPDLFEKRIELYPNFVMHKGVFGQLYTNR